MTKILLNGTLVTALLTLILPKDCDGQAFNYQPAFTINSQITESNTLRHVSAAGDVNNDGVGDFLIGERVSSAGLGASEVSVYSGSDGGLLHQFSGLGTSDARGMGDVNNDGHSDLIVGFRGDDTNGVNSGRATLFSGFDGSEILSVYGDDPGDWLGNSVDVVGDLDGDNLPDFIVGAYGTKQAFNNTGRARVFSSISGNLIHTIDPDASRETNFGRYVDSFGDVNGDGTDDLLIFTGVPGVSENEIQIFSGSNGQFIDSVAGSNLEGFGTASTDGIGDINQDGIEDFAVGADQTVVNGDTRAGAVNVYSGADRSLLLRIEGDEPELRLGSAISELGDIDGDGYLDFLVSAPANFSANDGQVRIYSGQDGSIVQTFTGADRFGSRVAGLGDLNGDGIADFIVQNSNGGAAGLGYSQVFLSSAVPEPSVILPAIFGLLSIFSFRRPKR